MTTRAMILAAGKGTRLQPLTHTTPKPMLPLQGRPLIHWQVLALKRAGVTDVIINLHHLGEQIEQYLGNGYDGQGGEYGLNIVYSRETRLLETGGAIVKALEFFDHQTFWLLNGDIWTDFDFCLLPESIPAHTAHIVLTPTPPYRPAGDFDYHDGQVTRRGSDYVYCGIAALTTELFSNMSSQHSFSLRDVFFDLITTQRLSAQIHTGQWQDIGSLAQYQALTKT